MAPLSGLLKRREGKKKGGRDKGSAQDGGDLLPPVPPPLGDEFALPTREYVRPDNQLPLTEVELSEEIPRMLTAVNPLAPKNLARFNMKERCFKFEAMVDQAVVHYACDGWLLHSSSEDARKQAEAEKAEAAAAARFQSEVERAAREKDAGMETEAPDDSRQLRNRFNFADSAAQTFNYPPRDRSTMTEPPPTATAHGSCSAWEVYDDYQRDVERQRAEEATKPRAGGRRSSAATAGHAAAAAAAAAGASLGSPPPAAGGAVAEGRAAGGMADSGEAALEGAGPSVARALGILDRLICQNSMADVAMDFKYWDDPTDAFRPGEGSLLPLWTFRCPRGRKHVTSIVWSPVYHDMFAVGYGSFHFHRQTGGLVAVHSLKNPAAPECLFTTASGVMAVDFHPSFANLLAVGFYDGSVAVFDARSKGGPPLYQATVRSGKHSDTVWQVSWQEDELQKTLQFVSVSTDGDVTLWTLEGSELRPERLARLTAPSGRGAAAAGPAAAAEEAGAVAGTAGGQAAAGASGGSGDGALARQVVGGVSMDFNWAPGREHEYLVGTESGGITECSKAYSSDCLASFGGHAGPVYAVRWNRVHPSVFLSASADWTLCIWDARRPSEGPVLSFDAGAAIGDAAWAPHSATTLAAADDDGRVHVFDLAANRLAPLCTQKVARSARLTKVAFNKRHPVLLVGDSKGNVLCLKLSPNLRRSSVAAGAGPAGSGSGAMPSSAPAGGHHGAPAAAALPGAGPPVASSGSGSGAAAGAEQASARAAFEATERQRLEAVMEVARKGRSHPAGAAA